MGVDDNEILCFIIEYDLLIGMGEIEFRVEGASSERCKQVIDQWQGVGVDLGCLVYCEFIVPTDPNAVVFLHDWHDWSCPISKIHWLNDTLFFQLREGLFHPAT